MNRRELIRALSGGVAGIPAVKSVERIDASSNDVIVVKCLTVITPQIAAEIKELFQNALGDRKIIVIDEAIEITTLKA